MSPCLTALPPPPLKWQLPQFCRVGRSHALRRGYQVQPFGGTASGAFAVQAGIGVANQAVDVCLLS
jgi:hypothetical protein